MKKKYQLREYDVWGNEKEGFNVNDVYSTDEIYEIDLDWNDKLLIQELKKQGLIKKGIRSKSIETSGDGDTIYFDYKGKPEFELRLCDEDNYET